MGSTVEVVVGSVLVVSNSSNRFSIFPSRTSISCVSRNCFANLEIVFHIQTLNMCYGVGGYVLVFVLQSFALQKY